VKKGVKKILFLTKSPKNRQDFISQITDNQLFKSIFIKIIAQTTTHNKQKMLLVAAAHRCTFVL